MTVDVLHDAVASLHQIDRIDLTSITQGEEYSLSVSDGTDTHTVSYTAQAGDTAAAVRAGLMGSIGADPDVSSMVRAEGEGASTIVLSTVDAGTALQTSVAPVDSATVTTVSDTSANVNQVSQVTVAGTIEAGDSYTLSIGGDSVSHTVSTGESIADIRDSLLTRLDADATISTTVTASAGSEDGQIILTATTAGATFTASGSTQNTTSLASTDDNAATVSHELSGTDTFGAVYGGDGHDALMGGGAADNLFGGDGDDRIAGSGGDDVLKGDAGEEKLQGGSGCGRSAGAVHEWLADVPPPLATSGPSHLWGLLPRWLFRDIVIRPPPVEIDAPPHVVWEAFIDFDRYAEWTPFHRKVAVGEEGEGAATGSVRMTVAMGPILGTLVSTEAIGYVASQRHILMYSAEPPSALRMAWLLPAPRGSSATGRPAPGARRAASCSSTRA